MKAYKIDLLVIDHDDVGAENIRDIITNESYPNRCISPRVMMIETKDIGEWTDEHPLNKRDTSFLEYLKLFNLDGK